MYYENHELEHYELSNSNVTDVGAQEPVLFHLHNKTS